MRVGEQFCPGVLRAVQAKDGLLTRIRVPGGLIEADQLKTIADLSLNFADGTIEITSRANLQLRGIREQNLNQIVEIISSSGLLPSPLHDRVRNIVTNPIAGLDPDELVDPRPFVHELDRRLREDIDFAKLHPKFSFAIYADARRFSRAHDDISLQALELNSASHFYLSVGGAASGFVVQGADAVHCMVSLAKMCIDLAGEYGTVVRAKEVVKIPNALRRIVDAHSRWLTPSPAPPSPLLVGEALQGIYPTLQDDRVNVIPSVPLGRLNPEQARCLADLSNEWEGDLRLAPWRGAVLGAIPKLAANDVVRQLRTIGLACDGRDGFQGISACAGVAGCDASQADVRGDAALLAQRLSGHATPSRWTVNLSGCDKQCARRRGATVDLIATQSGYTLNIAGRHVSSDCSSKFALDAVAELHKDLLSEVTAR